MKILIAVPTFENVDVDCFKSIYDLEKPCDSQIELEFITGYDCAKARNDIAKKAINGNFDYVFMVDSDIILPKQALVKLLLNQKELCFGIYPRKYTEYAEVIKNTRPAFWDVYSIEEAKMDDLVEVKAIGFGCALIKTDVFNKLNYPYFKYQCYENGDLLSEDFYFCERARLAGFSIYADFGVKCGHKGLFTKRI